jgi:peptidyl-lysine (3S)-dioxygenase / protease
MGRDSAVAIWAREQLQTLQADYHDYNSSVVPVLSYPSSLDFSKLVSKGQPCIFSVFQPNDSATYPWPACSWTRADLEHKVKETVEVALTPYGNADALVAAGTDAGRKVFLQPANQQWSITKLFDALEQRKTPVCYLQSQNSNLTTTPLEPLLSDLPKNFDFAAEVLGQPDACNIWLGDERSVTSVHRDPYENLYLVLRGSKTFRLWAPVDEATMPTKMVRTGRYELSKDNQFHVVMDEEGEIPWVDLDPPEKTSDVGRMRTAVVSAGQMLYLPAGWYHHVSQACGTWHDGSTAPCIAVNYWYDQEYEGERYVMRQLMARLVEAAKDP